VTRALVIVDDDEMLRRLLTMLIGADDRFSVVAEGSDGEEALRLLDEHDPDVLLLDLAMPRMDGLQVLDRLDGRARPRTVVLTGFADPQTHERVLELGAAACLVKGQDFDRLLEVLATI
jgi:DNA-binding NarL/FixJ family response regulator